MKIEGTREEIAWVKEVIKNSCSRCPFLESCNKQAKEEGANGNLKSCGKSITMKEKQKVIIRTIEEILNIIYKYKGDV